MASPILQYCVTSSDMSLLLSASMLLYNSTKLYLFSRNPATLVHLVSLYLNLVLVLQLTLRVWAMSSSLGENFSDSKPNPVVDQNLLIPNLECTLLYLKLFGLVEIRTQPLSYSYLVGIWAMSPSRRKTFLICKLDLVTYQSPQSSVFSRHLGDVVVRKENLPDTKPYLKN